MQVSVDSDAIDKTWSPILKKAFAKIDPRYLELLEHEEDWLPGNRAIFNAFSIPIPKVKYILFGESPYPRNESANGYAFWDAAVDGLWSDTGLSKRVNRATSLRNLLKMLLIARGDLQPLHLTQQAIKAINKTGLITTIDELFQNLLNHGFLLLNASLTLTRHGAKFDAKAWLPFIASILQELRPINPEIELVLLGNIAKTINKLPEVRGFKQFSSEHPYNLSFVTSPDVIDFFQRFDLLAKRD